MRGELQSDAAPGLPTVRPPGGTLSDGGTKLCCHRLRRPQRPPGHVLHHRVPRVQTLQGGGSNRQHALEDITPGHHRHQGRQGKVRQRPQSDPLHGQHWGGGGRQQSDVHQDGPLQREHRRHEGDEKHPPHQVSHDGAQDTERSAAHEHCKIPGSFPGPRSVCYVNIPVITKQIQTRTSSQS